MTNAAGWLSMIPGPIGSIASLANAVGEGMQGNWGTAAIAGGTAVLGMVGLGVVGKIAKEAEEISEGAGIVNRGGRFATLDAAKLPGEVGHHVPQNAFNRTIGLSRADGPAIGMTFEDHAITRTFAGRGQATMRLDTDLTARGRLANDIQNMRSLFGKKYNQGSLEAIKYAKTLPEFLK